jgi:DNA-binding transcriptional LysR family regulator
MTTTARLKALVAVADTGSVRAAAQRLVITESAVSAAVAALTRDIGVLLVEREGRGLRLTASGRTFAGYARTILGMHEQAISAARGILDPEHGRVRIAAVTTAGDHVMPRLLASFRADHPHVDLELEVRNRDQVWSLLDSHQADIVIAGRPPEGLADAVVRALRRNQLVVAGAPAIAARFDLGATTWLLREHGSGTRATCEALLDGLEIRPPRLTLGSNGAVIAGAVAGLGVTLVSRDAVAAQLASGELAEVAVPGTPMRRPWHAVTHAVAPPSALLLIEHLLLSRGTAKPAWRRPAQL